MKKQRERDLSWKAEADDIYIFIKVIWKRIQRKAHTTQQQAQPLPADVLS